MKLILMECYVFRCTSGAVKLQDAAAATKDNPKDFRLTVASYFFGFHYAMIEFICITLHEKCPYKQ